MADKLRWLHTGGGTPPTTYATIRDRTGQGWNGSTFVTWTSTRSTFAVALTQVGTTTEVAATMPSIGNLAVDIDYWTQAGGSPSDSADTLIGKDGGYWDGTTLTAQGSVGSVTGNVTGSVGSIASGGITAASVSTAAASKIAVSAPNVVLDTTIATSGVISTTVLHLNAGSSTISDAYNDCLVTIYSNNDSAFYYGRATAWDIFTGRITLSPATTGYTLAAGDAVRVVAIPNQIPAIFAKLPSRTYIAGSSQSTGSLDSADKTGLSLTQTFPSNFSSQVIDVSGRVDVSKIGGTSQTARDIGASVLLASGTGTGQLDFTSGVVKSNVTQSNGTTNASTAGYFAPDWGHVNAPTTTVGLSGTTVGTTTAVTNPVSGVDTRGYTSVLHVAPSGQPYTSIRTASLAATKPALVYVHAGAYTEEQIGKDGVDIYLSSGVVITSDGSLILDGNMFDSTGDQRYKVFGDGVLICRGDQHLLELSGNNDFLSIECDHAEVENSVILWDLRGGIPGATSYARIKCRNSCQVTGTGKLFDIRNNDQVSIEAPTIVIPSTATIGNIANATARVTVSGAVTFDCVSPFTGSLGTIICNGDWNGTNSVTNGINAPSGVNVVLNNGTLRNTSGGHSLTGIGTFWVGAFAYKTDASSATTIYNTPTALVVANLDAAMSSRAPATATTDIQSRLPAALTGGGNMKTDALKINGSDPATLIAASVGTIPTAASIRIEMDSNSTKLAAMFAKLPSRAYIAGSSQVTGSLDAADKTGYALTQAFPSNFSSLSIDGSGTVALQAASVTAVRDSVMGGKAFAAGSVDDVSPTVLSFKGDSGLSASNDFYSGAKALVTFTSGVLQGLSNPVHDYDGATRLMTFVLPWPVAPANTDTFIIMGRMGA